MLDYGFDVLENKLIDIFHSISPDMKEAERLLSLGADINALNDYMDENVLSNSLRAYDSNFFCDMGEKSGNSFDEK